MFATCPAVQTHSSPGVGTSRQTIPATAPQAYQRDVENSSDKPAKAEVGVSRGEADEGSIASATVGWFTGAAGQLAASRPGKVNLAEQRNPLLDTYAGLSLSQAPVRELPLCMIPHHNCAVSAVVGPKAAVIGVPMSVSIHGCLLYFLQDNT